MAKSFQNSRMFIDKKSTSSTFSNSTGISFTPAFFFKHQSIPVHAVPNNATIVLD